MRFPCWQADRVVVEALTPEHGLLMLNRHTSLDFLIVEEKAVLGLAADLCSRDFKFIHLKDACSFGIYYPPPSTQSQTELTDHFYFCVLCYLKCFSWLIDFHRGDLFLRH